MPIIDIHFHDPSIVCRDHHSSSFAAGSGDLVSVPIKNNNNLQYFSEIEIGQNRGLGPSQKFNVIVDTGSDRLWVPSHDCTSAVCKAHHRFSETESHSFQPLTDRINLSYGTGSVHAKLGKDLVKFANNVPISNAYPIALSVQQSAKPFTSLDRIDGIFGIGKSAPFSDSKPVFSVYLSNDTAKNGSLTFGGLDARHIDERAETHVHSVIDPKTWSIDLVDIKVGDQRLGVCPGGPCKALIDTGSSLVTGPPRDVEKLLYSGVHATCDGYGQSPSPVVRLIFKDKAGQEVEYPLTSKEYSIDFKDAQKECKVGFGPLDMGKQKWVIGDTFLRRYVSTFDKQNHQISFVKSKHDDEDIGVLTRGVGDVNSLVWDTMVRKQTARQIGNSFLFN